MKCIFFGTPEFAVPILEKLAHSEYEPIAVFCAPDKPVGRKQILTFPPIKIAAQKYGLPVYQPKDKNELTNQLKTLNYQLIIAAAYGLIVPKEVLDAPQFGCLNIHPSLLPKYRGPSPIQSAIFNGDTKTGVTIFKMDEGIDTGAIIAQATYFLSEANESKKYTTPELSEKLSGVGADLLIETLPDWLAGKIAPTPQDNSIASYTKIITKEDGKIDWSKSAESIEKMTRAFYPWPAAWTIWNNKILKILETDVVNGGGKKPGEVFLKNNEPAVRCGENILIIKKLQLEGGKILSAKEFLNGHKNFINTACLK